MARDHLLQRLDLLSRVTVLEALSGHGRTTLAAVWADQRRARGDRVVWMHADATLGTVDAFERCLRDGLRDVAHDPDEGRTIVVVDELDSAGDPGVVDLLCQALAQDRRLYLLVSVRMAHPLVGAAQRAGLPVEIVSGDDLTIGAGEVGAFAEAWGHEITPDRAHRLHGLVGGWLLPLRLVLDATPPWADEFTTDVAAEFFEHTVLPEVLDEGSKALATRVALTNPVTPATVRAAAVSVGCTSSDTERHLADLQRVGVLQPAPHEEKRQWRIPTLVRRSLVSAFERSSSEEQVRCHRVMAETLHGTRSSLGAVLVHARRGEHWRLLSDLWEEHALQLALDHPEAAVEAYARVPDEALVQNPALVVPRAIAGDLAAHRDEPRHAAVLRSYVAVGRGHWFDADAARTPAELVDVGVATVVVRRDDGDLAGARALAVELAERLEAMPGGSAAAPLRSAWLALQRGMTELMIGDLPAATSWCSRAVNVAPAVGADFIATHAAGLVALVHAVDGATDHAHRWLAPQRRRQDGIAPWLDRLVSAPARITRTLLALDRLDREEAERWLADLEDGAAELWPFVVHAGTRHALLFGEPMRMLADLEHLAALHARQLTAGGLARRIIDRCRADLLMALGEANQAARVTAGALDAPASLAVPSARLHLAAGDPGRARRIASAGVDDDTTSLRDRIELSMIEAAGAAAMGEDDRAADRFEQARELARGAGIGYAELLLPQAVVDRLDGGSAGDTAGARRPYPESLRLVRLSPREAAVLDLMQENASVASIARSLTVSVNTVKKQTVSIYAKLGVHDRVSALLEARRLGLTRTIRGPNGVAARGSGPVAADNG